MKKEIQKLLDTCIFSTTENISNYGGVNEYYKADKKVHDEAVRNCKSLLNKIKSFKLVPFRQACKDSWAGRLGFIGNTYHLEYIAGQYYDLELPQAIRAVLKTYIELTK